MSSHITGKSLMQRMNNMGLSTLPGIKPLQSRSANTKRCKFADQFCIRHNVKCLAKFYHDYINKALGVN